MDPLDDWGISRSLRRRRRRRIGIASVVVIVLLGIGAWQMGQLLDPQIQPTGGGVTTVGAPIAQSRTSAAATPVRSQPQPRLLTLITRDVDPGPGFDRVYLVPGKLSATQARDGLKPTIFVRPGERLKVKLVNPDGFDHTWTFSGTRVNVTAFKHSTEYSRVFRAPKAVGSYDFFCVFRKAGMNGRVVVTN